MKAGGRQYTRDEGRELSSRAIRNGDTSYVPKEVYAEIEARRRMESAQNALDAVNRQSALNNTARDVLQGNTRTLDEASALLDRLNASKKNQGRRRVTGPIRR